MPGWHMWNKYNYLTYVEHVGGLVDNFVRLHLAQDITQEICTAEGYI